jgi:hypothetical protein
MLVACDAANIALDFVDTVIVVELQSFEMEITC